MAGRDISIPGIDESSAQASTKRQPDASRYKVWGCIAWYLLELHQIGRKYRKYHQCRFLQSILGLILSGRAMSCTFHIRTASQQHTTYNFRNLSLRHLMTSISGLPASIDPLRKVERTYAEKRDRTRRPCRLLSFMMSPRPQMKHPTNVQHSFHKGCQHPMCSKSSHSDLELHSFQGKPTESTWRTRRSTANTM